jgi:hypothetical protein
VPVNRGIIQELKRRRQEGETKSVESGEEYSLLNLIKTNPTHNVLRAAGQESLPSGTLLASYL